HDHGPGELLLEVVDPGLEHALGLDGGVELGVLREVAVAPGLGDLLGDPGHVLVLHLVELGLELVVAFLRHGDPVGGHAVLSKVARLVAVAAGATRSGRPCVDQFRSVSVPDRVPRPGAAYKQIPRRRARARAAVRDYADKPSLLGPATQAQTWRQGD